MPIKLTIYGFREWFGSGVIALILLLIATYIALTVHFLTGCILCGVFVVFWLCIAAFFRDPARKIPSADNVLVSPADGVVRDIEITEFEQGNLFDNNQSKRIGIFLSVLDVHLNRAPCDFTVEAENYKKGAYHDARDLRASKENESMTISGTADIAGKTFGIAIKQISGAIARRIVCAVKINSRLKKGERFGMIKFGSRTELYLPIDPEIEVTVNLGDRVYAGSTVIARIIPDQPEIPKNNDDNVNK